MRVHVLVAVLFGLMAFMPTRALANAPAFEFESILDTFFSADNGTLRLGDYVLAFAPEGEIDAEVAVLGPDKTVRARFGFLAEPRNRSAVFARVGVQGPAEVALTEPGIYNLVFIVNNKPVTSFPFVLKAGAAGDAFDPQKTFYFDGLWRTWGHLTMRPLKDQQIPQFNFWVGGLDLPKDAKKGMYFAELFRDGTQVAHSRRSQGHIAPGHFKRTQIELYHPHDEKAANATPFALSDWLVDGSYELRITRQSDSATIRSFAFTVADKQIQPHPRTALDHDPHVNHITPRIAKKGTNVFEMTEAIWIEGK